MYNRRILSENFKQYFSKEKTKFSTNTLNLNMRIESNKGITKHGISFDAVFVRYLDRINHEF